LYRVEQWAEDIGSNNLYGISAEELNDDRIGRTLDALAPNIMVNSLRFVILNEVKDLFCSMGRDSPLSLRMTKTKFIITYISRITYHVSRFTFHFKKFLLVILSIVCYHNNINCSPKFYFGQV
jgi:hypothetical protein